MSARGDMGRAFLDAREVAGLLEWTTELEEAPEVSGGHWVYREESVTTPRQRVIQLNGSKISAPITRGSTGLTRQHA